MPTLSGASNVSCLSNVSGSSTTSTSTGSSSNPPSTSNSKPSKGKKAAQPHDNLEGADTKDAKKPSRVSWSNYPEALAKLEAKLADYQVLDGRKDSDKRSQMKEDVANDILGDDKLRKQFHSHGFTDADIRAVSCLHHFVLQMSSNLMSLRPLNDGTKTTKRRQREVV